MVGDGEPMGLVAHPLQQIQGLRPPRQPDRLSQAGPVDLLEALGQRGHRDHVANTQFLHDTHGDPQLALTTVHQQEVRWIREATGTVRQGRGLLGHVGAETTCEHLGHRGVVVVAGNAPDPEPAVVGLLGQAVLEHDHRPYVVGALQVAHVEALDAQRGLRQVQGRLEFVQRTGPAVVVSRTLHPVPDELLLGVAGHRRQQVPLAPTLRYPDLHTAAPLAREPLGQQDRVVRQGGHQHRPGHAARRILSVVRREDLAHQLGCRQVLHPVDHEPLPAEHLPPPHVEHLDRRLQVVAGYPEHVDLLVSGGDHLLALDHPAHARQAVPVAAGSLELEGIGGGSHLGPQLDHHFVRVALQEPQQVPDEVGVGVGRDLADTWAGALLDVEQQAGSAHPLVGAELGVRAGPQGERLDQLLERLPDGAGVPVGPEVPDPPATLGPGHHRAGPFVGDGDGQERIALVVLHVDVEPGRVLLDQAALQHEGLELVGHLDPLDVNRLGEHPSRAGSHTVAPAEIAAEPVSQALGLAHVQHAALGVQELVGTRRIGDGPCGWPLQHARSVGALSHPAPMLVVPAWRPAPYEHPRSTTPWRGVQAAPTDRQSGAETSEGPRRVLTS